MNDLCVKGKISSLNLLNMLLRFVMGQSACAGDLRQFYPSMALEEEQWNLQRVLWKDNMDVEAEVVELVICSLIFGVRPVSALSERAVIMLADHIRNQNPRLADLLTKSRFVDDLANSGKNQDDVKNLIKSADEVFRSVGLECKGWSISGSNPHPDVTSDGVAVEVGGMVWWPKLDVVFVKIPPLHFGKISHSEDTTLAILCGCLYLLAY